MKLTIITLYATLFSTALMATETADYKVIARDGKFEIRDYPALKVARTASGRGDFMRLFRYISGGNEGERKIAMTAPVLIRHEGEKPGMSFIMPRDVAAATVPKPSEDAVELDTFGPGRFAVARFSGGRSEPNEAKALEALRRWLESHPDDELAGEVRAKLTSEPVRYATYTRQYLGWGVFALMLR